MGWYADQFLPRAIDFVMDTAPMRRLRETTAAPLEGTVLEIGFGSGLNLPHIPARVDRLLAVDPATLGRRLASERIAEAPFPVEFVGLDGQQIDLPDQSVDHALCTWTLCTIPDAVAALREVRRILRPGGVLRFVEHGRHEDPRVAVWQDRVNPVQNLLAGGCNLNRPIDALVRDAGFAVEELEQFSTPGPKIMTWMYMGTAVPA